MKPIYILIILFCLTFNVLFSNELNDPYEILNKYIEKIGGLEKLQSIESEYIEGSVKIVDSPMSGTVKSWRKGCKYRNETDLGIFVQIEGGNEVNMWAKDMNGKIQVLDEPELIKSIEKQKLMDSYDFLDVNSPNFEVSLLKPKKVNNHPCYVVEIKCLIDKSKSTMFINKSSYILEQQIEEDRNVMATITFSDYKKRDDILTAFKHETFVMPFNQKTKMTISSIERNIKINDKLFYPDMKKKKDYKLKDKTKAENIVFDFIENHIYIPVEIKGKKKLWVLDSGASKSVIDSHFAEEIGLKGKGTFRVMTVDGYADAQFVKIPHLNLDGVKIKKQTIISMPISKMFEENTGIEVGGILGYDFISRFVLKINYAEQKISLYESDDFNYSGDGQVVDVSDSFANILSIKLSVEDSLQGDWTVDLGANGSSFHYKFANSHNLLNRDGDEFIFKGANGLKIKNKVIKFNNIKLADYTINNNSFGIPLEQSEGMFLNSENAGNLGNDILQNFNVYINYDKSQFILEKGKKFNKDNNQRKRQFSIIKKGNSYLIDFIVSDSNASKAGLREGDNILEIDNKTLDELGGLRKVREYLKDENRKNISLNIQRGEGVETLLIEL